VDELQRLHDEIGRCQRLAANVTDTKTDSRLRDYIKELQDRERHLENKLPRR
jgi:hypothetical protein